MCVCFRLTSIAADGSPGLHARSSVVRFIFLRAMRAQYCCCCALWVWFCWPVAFFQPSTPSARFVLLERDGSVVPLRSLAPYALIASLCVFCVGELERWRPLELPYTHPESGLSEQFLGEKLRNQLVTLWPGVAFVSCCGRCSYVPFFCFVCLEWRSRSRPAVLATLALAASYPWW